MVRSSCLLSRSVAAKVSMCSVCVRTGWWGYLLSCHRPQNCTYSTSQEIGLSPCVNFSPGGKEFRQQWTKCLRENSINFLPYGYPALHMIADCHVLAVFFCCISWYLLCCRKVYCCRHANVRLHVYRWSFSTTLSKQVQSITFFSLPFFSGCQTCRSPWPHYVSRPCGCRWTSHSLSLLFRLMWITRRARRCSPVCCCLSSPAMTTTVMFKRQICRLKCVLW